MCKWRKVQLALIIISVLLVEQCHMQKEIPIKIGGLFDGSVDTENAFKYAVDAINNERYNQTKLRAVIERVPFGSEFDAAQSLCKMMKHGVTGIVGPTSVESSLHVRSICDAKEMPLIETRIDSSSRHVINLHPHPDDLGRAYLELILAAGWKGFTILYQSAPWLPHVEYLLKNYHAGYTITVRQFEQTAYPNYRSQLRTVKKSGDYNIVLCCSIDVLPEILKQAQQIGLMTEQHHFIITSMDMHTIDLEPFQHSGANITGIRLISPNDPVVKQVTNFFTHSHKSDSNENDYEDEFAEPGGLTAGKIRVEAALTYDAVLLFSKVASHKSDQQQEKLRCDDDSSYVNGMSMFNLMKTPEETVRGMSGEIHLNAHGYRERFELEITDLVSDGLKVVGKWNSSSGLIITRERIPESITDDSLRNKTIIVLSTPGNPYCMLKDSKEQLSGNDQYEGFGVEIIQKLSEKLGFNYTFQMQLDKKYGSIDKTTKEWDGMIRQIQDGKADLAITDLTITSERESGADFTMPFMTLGISILFQKPQKEPPSLFSFLKPFSNEVWLCLGSAFFLVSLSLFIMGRLSPTEWDNPYPCIEEPENLMNQFSFRNSMWFSIGALLQQGSEIAPKAPSTRIVASLWWFFTLIMVSSYTANLAAFLTIEVPFIEINSAEDLYNLNGKIPYGAKKTGSTIDFFRDTENEVYKNMYKYMLAHPENMMEDNVAALERAKKGNYAFFMESSTINYNTERNCEVVKVGGELDEKGYGIAMKKDAAYRGALSEAVLQLRESGELDKMEIKWWKEKRGGGACSVKAGDGVANELGLPNVGGVFLVLAGGSGFATLIGLVRWFMMIRRNAIALKVSFKEEFINEAKFVVKFGGNIKTVRRRKSSSQFESVTNGSRRSRQSRSRSSTSPPPRDYGFKLSLKNVNKENNSADDEFNNKP